MAQQYEEGCTYTISADSCLSPCCAAADESRVENYALVIDAVLPEGKTAQLLPSTMFCQKTLNRAQEFI